MRSRAKNKLFIWPKFSFEYIFRNALVTLEKEREAKRKALDKANKLNEEISRDRDISRKDLKKAEGELEGLFFVIYDNEGIELWTD